MDLYQVKADYRPLISINTVNGRWEGEEEEGGGGGEAVTGGDA